MTPCKRGHNAKRDSRGECVECVKQRRINGGYYSVYKEMAESKPKHHPAILPVADYGFIRPPTKAELMARK